MRFLADENISKQVVDRLRAAGLEVMRVADVIRTGATDEEVLRLANKEQLILITKDDDFGSLVVRHQHKIRGLILLQLDRLSRAARDERTVDVIAARDAPKFEENLIVIRPERISIRPIP